jgi:hypothetical protein
VILGRRSEKAGKIHSAISWLDNRKLCAFLQCVQQQGPRARIEKALAGDEVIAAFRGDRLRVEGDEQPVVDELIELSGRSAS